MYNLLRLVLHSTMTTQQVTNLIALITQRLERRAQDRASVLFTEPTEEIRAQWLDVLMPLLTCENTVRPDAVQVEKWLDVIQLAIGDPSPEVQKKGAYMLKSLAMKAPKEIALTGDRPMQFCILPLLYHKHAPVRTLGLQAAKQVGKSIPSSVPVLFRFDKVANRQAAFPLLVHDTSLMVRSTLIQVAASYLKECGPRPRYDNAPYVVPILLGCTADDVQSIADDAKKVIDEVAEAFAGDMLAAGLWDEVSAVNEESRDKIRRVAGLQHAVHQCYRECLKELLNETNELNRDRRIRALGVLESLIGYATEEDVMGSCERILDTLFNVLVNGFDESSVVVKAKMALRCFGNRDVRAVSMTRMLNRLDEKTALHADTVCSDNGLVVTLQMLISLLEGYDSTKQYPPYELERLLDILCRPYFCELFIEQEACAVQAAQLLGEIVRLQPERTISPDRLVFVGLILQVGLQLHISNTNGSLPEAQPNKVKTDDIVQRYYVYADPITLENLLAGTKKTASPKLKTVVGKAAELIRQRQSEDASLRS